MMEKSREKIINVKKIETILAVYAMTEPKWTH